MAARKARFGLDDQGIDTTARLHWNLAAAPLVEAALARGEGRLASHGPLVVATGKHTGRSARDKFIVRDEETGETVWWDNNKAMSPEHFAALKADFLAALKDRETLFVQDLYGGSQPEHRIRVRVINEYAWHSLFIRTMLVRPEAQELEGFLPEYTVIDLPGFRADPERHGCRSETVIAVSFTDRLILIGGTEYGGEMKKSVFGVLNYLLPPQGVMPMHCSANMDQRGENTAIFFGLSGTGKTTLSADPDRILIGDDEHGWSDGAVFNFEGGCYAKMIRLSAEAEPEIHAATRRFGAVLENVVIDPDTREPDFDDASLAENSRGAYPIGYIPNSSAENMGPPPKNLVMLTADAFGVLPPIAKLTPDQAMYHFLSGYTAKVAGTEIGVTAPEATFSTCFGAPFMPRHPSVYGNLLKKRIAEGNVDCWLINTGWTGGKYGTGHRMPIQATRALLNAALDGSLKEAEYRTDPWFGFAVPVSVPGIDDKILDPRATWADPEAYDTMAAQLVQRFIDNFAKFEPHVSQGVREAAPAPAPAQEQTIAQGTTVA
ncbi:MAG: phosphoenolpyruvate carboxykinase [Sphingomonadaceae bacterium]